MEEPRLVGIMRQGYNRINKCKGPLSIIKAAQNLYGKKHILTQDARWDSVESLTRKLLKMCLFIIEDWKPSLDFEVILTESDFITDTKIIEREVDRNVVDSLRLIKTDKADEVYEYAGILLESSYPDVPHLREDLFDIIYSSFLKHKIIEAADNYIKGEMCEDTNVEIALSMYLHNTKEEVFVYWSPCGKAGLTDTETIIKSWTEIVFGMDDVLIWPLSCDWAICYFHHDKIEIGIKNKT